MQADLGFLCSGLSQPSFDAGNYRIVLETTELCIFIVTAKDKPFFIENIDILFYFLY